MDTKIKHRIIGIIVIAAIAVILIPLLFTHSNRRESEVVLSAHVPKPPRQSTLEEIAIPPDNTPKPAKVNGDLATQALQPAVPQSNTNAVVATPVPIKANPDNAVATNNAAVQTTVQTAQSQQNANQNNNTTMMTAASSANDITNDATQPSSTPVSSSTTMTDNSEPTTAVPSTTISTTTVTPAAKPHYAKHERTHLTKKLHAIHVLPKKIVHVKPVAGSWTIQLGSFSDKQNANKLVKKLRAQGFPAYAHVATTDGKTLTRVYVGPEIKREKADATITRLHKLFNMKGVVVKYKVT